MHGGRSSRSRALFWSSASGRMSAQSSPLSSLRWKLTTSKNYFYESCPSCDGVPLEALSHLFSQRPCLTSSPRDPISLLLLVFRERLEREKEILEERAEKRLEIFKNLVKELSSTGSGPEEQVSCFTLQPATCRTLICDPANLPCCSRTSWGRQSLQPSRILFCGSLV